MMKRTWHANGDSQITSQIIKNAYQQMRRCTVTADSAAIPFEDVRIAITEGNDKEIQKLRNQVLEETYDTSVEVFDGELMNTLNEIFDRHFVAKGKRAKDATIFDERFAADTPSGRTLWKEYHEDVIEAINTYDSTPRVGWPVGVSSRVALLLYWSPQDRDIPLPILGEMSVLAITNLCASVPLALTEVSRNGSLAADPVVRIRGASMSTNDRESEQSDPRLIYCARQ
jgi:hypothetical protein